MIIARCKHCQARVQVPSPGVYKCHSCGQVFEVNLEELPKNKPSTSPASVEIQKKQIYGPTCRRHPDRGAEKFCKSCGDFLCDDCAIRVENNYYCSECIRKFDSRKVDSTQRTETVVGESSIPFENMEKLGFWKSILLTFKELFLNFGKFFDRTDGNSYVKRAFLLAVSIQVLGRIVDYIAFNYFKFGEDIDLEQVPEFMREFYEEFVIVSIKSVLLSPIQATIGILIIAVIYHIAVKLVGGVGSYLTTLKITSYAFATQIILVILFPIDILPAIIVFILSILIITQGCIRLHRLSEGRSVFVALSPYILFALLVVMVLLLTG